MLAKKHLYIIIIIFFPTINLFANYTINLDNNNIITANDILIDTYYVSVYLDYGIAKIPLYKIKDITSNNSEETIALTEKFWINKIGIYYGQNIFKCKDLILKLNFEQFQKECLNNSMLKDDENYYLLNSSIINDNDVSAIFSNNENLGDVENANIQNIIALLYFELFQYDEAYYWWSKALQNSSNTLYKHFMNQVKWLKEHQDLMNKEKIDDVILIYPNSIAKNSIAKVKSSIMQFQNNLNILFAFKPYKPIIIVIYPKEAFHEITGMPNWVKAYTKYFICLKEQDNFSYEIKHELVHAYINQLTLGRAPEWFQEGMAQYLSKSNKKLENTPIQATNNDITGVAYADDNTKRIIYETALIKIKEILSRNSLIALRKYMTLLRVGEEEKAFDYSFKK
jgi:hypothetical protein